MTNSFQTQLVNEAYARDVLLRSLSQATPLTAAREADLAIQQFIGGFLSDELRHLGITDIRRDSMGNLLARLPGTGLSDLGTVLFVVYVMTHPAGAMPDAFKPAIVDGRIYGETGHVARGRAACEQRGSLGSVLAALALIGRHGGPHAEVQLLALTSGETGNHGAASCAIRDFGLRADGAVLAICSDKRITVAHKGRVDVRVEIQGRAAHSSSPGLGINAVAGARWALDRLAEFVPSAPHAELGAATLVVTRLTTEPIAVHTIPAKCSIELDMRLLPADDPDERVVALQKLLAGVPVGVLSIHAGDKMFPCEVDPQSALVRSILSASREATGRLAGLQVMAASSDAGYFNRRGIPTVCYGAGAVARAHTDDDLVAINDVLEIAAAYAELMRTGCRDHAHVG
jgi:acetylornithine deacetylase/succinyl-diaminopimelate desuccinylase-like protein